MKTIIALSMLALLAAGGTATAGQKVVTIQFDGTCDTMTITPNKALALFGTSHTIGCQAHSPSSNPIPGVGIVVKRPCPKCSTRWLSIGETLPDNLGTPVGTFTILQYPLVTGGAWTVYTTSDGAVVSEGASGTYTVK